MIIEDGRVPHLFLYHLQVRRALLFFVFFVTFVVKALPHFRVLSIEQVLRFSVFFVTFVVSALSDR